MKMGIELCLGLHGVRLGAKAVMTVITDWRWWQLHFSVAHSHSSTLQVFSRSNIYLDLEYHKAGNHVPSFRLFLSYFGFPCSCPYVLHNMLSRQTNPGVLETFIKCHVRWVWYVVPGQRMRVGMSFEPGGRHRGKV